MPQSTQFETFASEYMESLAATMFATDTEDLQDALAAIRSTGAVWIIGNGGAASLASHMATDLQLAGIRAQALVDVAALTTYANDVDYAHSFTEQLHVLGSEGDVLIAISTSGTSPNIVQALFTAHEMGIVTIALMGEAYPPNPTDDYADILIPLCVRRTDGDGQMIPSLPPSPPWFTGIKQDLAEVYLHLICYWLMQEVQSE